MELVFGALLFIFGVCVGSFLNVVILRFGYRERGGERSQCMACGTVLRARDLVPLFSYLALRGRCRECGSRLLTQYPLVELATGLLFLMSYYMVGYAFSGVLFVATAGFWVSFLGLVVYDLRHTLVPLPFVYGMYGFAALSFLLTPSMSALWGVFVCAGFFALLTAVTRGKGMGIGDAYVAGALGLFLGVEHGVVASVFAVWIGALVGIALMLCARICKHLFGSTYGMRVTLKTEVPFAPFLALGALSVWWYNLGFASLGLSLPF